jgi:hypothetical protein
MYLHEKVKIDISSTLLKASNLMFYFDLLPPEILKRILLITDRKIIKCIYELINEESIKFMPSLNTLLDERKMQFPRHEGKAVLHMNYLEDSDDDLVKGDIIDHKFIFDGKNVVDLYARQRRFNELCLPHEWNVIENGIPLHYWTNAMENKIIWFDHKLVLNQCLNNLKYEKDEHNIYKMGTCFEYENTKYTMYFHIHDSDQNIFGDRGKFLNYEDELQYIEYYKYLLKIDRKFTFRTRAYWHGFNSTERNELYYW